ncbi:MAG: C-GCAxxG-C-C family protein [Oscillospiraceae bacterium]|nr:C-GCAxxG-C-C family protein [Oscillospiraceae bacterium]
MNRIEASQQYHDKGYNCCQSVLAAFADRLDIPEETALRLGAGFGSGAGTGELCGAITGAILALDLMAGGDMSQPVPSKRKAAARAREVQQRFTQQFGAVRCRELLKNEKEEASEAVRAMGITNHCGVMIATATELVEEMLEKEDR